MSHFKFCSYVFNNCMEPSSSCCSKTNSPVHKLRVLTIVLSFLFISLSLLIFGGRWAAMDKAYLKKVRIGSSSFFFLVFYSGLSLFFLFSPLFFTPIPSEVVLSVTFFLLLHYLCEFYLLFVLFVETFFFVFFFYNFSFLRDPTRKLRSRKRTT